jgi:AP-3 complex subunit delta-1
MSSSKFSLKRVGYLAACVSFNDDTDVMMLTTNMLKKVKWHCCRRQWVGY